MRDSTAKTIVNYALIDQMIANRESSKHPFLYKWYHQSTGNSGVSVIHMRDRRSLEEWIARWNHSNFANGWFYSLP